jgi:ABC-type multidrug transport system fused ATPase/permease subunit
LVVNYLRKLISILSKREKKQLIIVLLMMILGAFAEIVSIGVLPAFIAAVTKPDVLNNFPVIQEILKKVGVTNSEKLLLYGSVFMIVIFLLKNGYLTFLTYYKSKVVYDIQLRMSHDLFSAYLKAPYTFHLNRNSSELLGNVYDCVKIIVAGVIMPFITIVMEVLLLISIIVLLFSVEPIITLITVAVFGLSGYIYLKSTKKSSVNFGKELQKLRDVVYKVVTEGLVGLKDARVLNREDFFIQNFYTSSKKNANGLMHQSFLNGLTKPILETIAMIVMLSITVALVLRSNDLSGILPALALFGFASIRLMPSISQILGCFSSLRFSSPAINPVWKDLHYLKAQKEIQYKNHNQAANITLNKQIEFNKVIYHYPESPEPSLINVNLSIPSGKSIAFVGSSGAGKTTMVDLILGLLNPSDGRITADGIDIHTNIQTWQKQIGYIPQHIFLADNSIRNNIAFGMPDHEIDNDKVWQALKLAHLDTLVHELPEGLETQIGERGVRFSGGQRQRIGIARALYHDPKILVMDEATSALDNITERSIVQEIEALKGNRTIIVIAHRLTTVMNCDTIYFMDKGLIVDSGSYQELINKNESFRKMALVD